jgi:hypothetical protein
MEVKIEMNQKLMEPGIKTSMEEITAIDFETNPEKIEVIAECQKVPNEEATVEMSGVLYLAAR